MGIEAVHARTVDADVFLPADGLRLLGQHDGGGQAGRRFLVGRGDGEIVQLPLLPYLIMAAIAEGGVDGGWSAGQVGARVEAATGQGLTADTVRYLIAGKLAPLGLIAAGDAAYPPPMTPPPPAARGGGPLPRWAAGPAGRVLSWPIVGRVELLLLPHRRRRWAHALGAAGVLVCVAATAPIMTETGNRAADRAGSSARPGARAAAAGSDPSPDPASDPATAARRQAAAWVAQQVSPDVTVACDPGLCRQLQRDGFPAARLRPMPGGARALPGSGIVVATPAVRSQFGPRLAAGCAPGVIASFGAGATRVDIRLIAPAGPAAFAGQLAAEQSALAAAGRQLLGNKNLQVSPTAQAALSSGRVDARLLVILSLLSAQRPVRLVAFIGAPGAGAGAPLLEAELGLSSPAARSAVVALLDAQQDPYRPAAVTVVDGGTLAVVSLRFDAPADLNISQP